MLLADAFVTGWHATELARVYPGCTAAVFGAGTIGLLSAYSCLIRGADVVYVVDYVPERLEMAARPGPAGRDRHPPRWPGRRPGPVPGVRPARRWRDQGCAAPLSAARPTAGGGASRAQWMGWVGWAAPAARAGLRTVKKASAPPATHSAPEMSDAV